MDITAASAGSLLCGRPCDAEFDNSTPKLSVGGRTNASQHRAFQALWVQYDHLLPHARGGDNSLDNMVITCAPCNFGRGDYTLEKMGLNDPRTRDPVRSTWDGLERFR